MLVGNIRKIIETENMSSPKCVIQIFMCYLSISYPRCLPQLLIPSPCCGWGVPVLVDTPTHVHQLGSPFLTACSRKCDGDTRSCGSRFSETFPSKICAQTAHRTTPLDSVIHIAASKPCVEPQVVFFPRASRGKLTAILQLRLPTPRGVSR